MAPYGSSNPHPHRMSRIMSQRFLFANPLGFLIYLLTVAPQLRRQSTVAAAEAVEATAAATAEVVSN